MGCRHSRVYPTSLPGSRPSSNPSRTVCPSSPERGRASACSYRSFEDNDDLDPDFAPRPSSSLRSATPECTTRLPGVALVTPRGTFHRWAGNGNVAGQALVDSSRPMEGRRAARLRETTARSSVSHSSHASSGLSITDDIGVFQYFSGCVLPYRNRVALLDGATDQSMTVEELLSMTRRLSIGLRRAGFRRSDVLCLVCHNVLEYPAIFLAVSACGGRFTMLDPNTCKENLVIHLRKTCSTFLVASNLCSLVARKAAKKFGRLKKVFSIGYTNWCDSLAQLTHDTGSRHLWTDVRTSRDSVVILAPSTDVIDELQIVQLTHANLIACWSQLRQTDGLSRMASTDIVLGLIPYHHIFGLVVCLLGSLVQGTQVIVVSDFETGLMLRAMDQRRANLIHLLPGWTGTVSNHPLLKTHPAKQDVTVVVYGAPHVPMRHKRTLIGLGFRDIIYVHGYVETCSIATASRYSGVTDDSIGRPIVGTQAKVLDGRTGKRLNSHEEGVVFIKGPQVMKGYLDKHDDRTPVLDDDGWLRTGDMGWVDADGNLYLSCRNEEIITIKRYQIKPREIENVILHHPSVSEVVSVGLTDPVHGQIPKVYVILKPGYPDVSAHQLLAFANTHLLSYKQLRGGVELVSHIPRSSNGRILREKLKVSDSTSARRSYRRGKLNTSGTRKSVLAYV